MSLKIVFMGTPAFAVPSLEILLKHSFPVVAVVTAPDKPQGRGRHLHPSPVKEAALRHKLPLLQPVDLKDFSFRAHLSALRPDLIIVVAFRILPPEVYCIPRLASFNLHASLLPKYRGAAPIERALMNGESVTGVTTFLLREQVDTGAILLQQPVAIGPDETAGELRDRLAEAGANLVLETVRLLADGRVHAVPQVDAEASPAPKIRKEECWIDWTRPGREIHNFVRGLSPEPAAMTTCRGKLLKVFRTRIVSSGEVESGWESLLPGVIALSDKDRLMVRTGDGILAVEEIQQEGRKRMKTGEFLRGFKVERGAFLSRS